MNLGTKLLAGRRARVLTAANAQSKKFARYRRLYELPLVLCLTILWMLLWQQLSLISLLSGLLVAEVLVRLFFLPPVELSGRFNPVAAIKYMGFFLYELMLGSLQVAFQALNPKAVVKPVVIAVRLTTHSDFILTMTGLTVSLIPGSLIVDVDRFNSTLYLHALHAPTAAAQQRVRAEVLRIERLLLAAIGSKEELEAARERA